MLETVKNAETAEKPERKATVKITVFDNMISTLSFISTCLFDLEMAHPKSKTNQYKEERS